MDKRELDLHLKSNKPIKSAMLFGVCDYLADLYSEKIISTAGEACDILKIYFDEYSFGDAKNFLSQSSLFGDKLILLIKSDKKIPKNDLKELISIADKNDALFIFRFLGDMTSKEKDYYELFSAANNALFVRFFNPNSVQEAATYLKTEAIQKNINISPEALDELLTLKNMDLEAAVKELEKFLAVTREVTKRDVKALVEESDDTALEKFFETVLEKKDFYAQLLRILEKAEFDEVRIVLFFEYYLQELFLFLLYSKAYGTIDAKKITGKPLPDFVAKAKAAKAIKIGYKSYVRMLEILLEADLSLKLSKNSDKKATLIHYLIKLQNNL